MNRLFCSLLFLAMFWSGVSAQNPEALKPIKEFGGVVFPLANDEWEVEFHLRGRDLMTDDGLKLLLALGLKFCFPLLCFNCLSKLLY